MRRLLVGVATAFALLPATALAGTYTVDTKHFDVVVGPANNSHHCDIVGDVYKPDSASASSPAASILTTNGFGGSKDGQADFAKMMAARGYVVLSYSGLGFGGSGCKITLDDPDYDGRAGSQLVSYLGGAAGIAKDGSTVDYVIRDDGSSGIPNDPRVGMIGGSYGGQIQFAVAGDDPRVDTIIPQITWNDLSYSLAPNNAELDHGVTYNTPGVEKFEWTTLFTAVGIVDGVQGAPTDPTRMVGLCPNFDDRACPGKLHMDLTGYPDQNTVSFARHASVESYIDRIKVPVFLSQGQNDTLFNLQESIATYQALRARGVPVKMFWQEWGHSGGAAPGELNDSDPASAYDTQQYVAWFDHYLRGAAAAPELGVGYFRDWVSYTGNAAPAYASAPGYPVGAPQTLALSGSSLVAATDPVIAGSQSFVTPAQAPSSYSETSALQGAVTASPAGAVSGPSDAPGTFASFTSAPLSNDTFVAGVPTVDVALSAPLNAVPVDPAADLVLFFKLYDVAADGSVTLVHRLVAPVRFADPNRVVHVELPGIVHKFPAGHKLQLVIAGSDAAYRGDSGAYPVTVSTSPAVPGKLTLPIVAG